jgi:sporulation protein YlmC with PRC-barrel domain
MSQSQHTNTELSKLSETDLTLADPTEDIRGSKVVDTNREDIGHVGALFIDRGERKVRLLEIRAGGFLGIGDRHFLLPVEAITKVADDEVHINQTRDIVAHSPAYDPELEVAPTPEYWGPYYGYYGMSPYFGSGSMYPYITRPGRDSREETNANHNDSTRD